MHVCLRLFLFALSVLPLVRKDLEAVNIMHREMRRLIIGWRWISGEDWAATSHRMNAHVGAALIQFLLKTKRDSIPTSMEIRSPYGPER